MSNNQSTTGRETKRPMGYEAGRVLEIKGELELLTSRLDDIWNVHLNETSEYVRVMEALTNYAERVDKTKEGRQ